VSPHPGTWRVDKANDYCSQGAQVTHKAAGLLSEAVIERVAAVVVFGDPDKVLPFPEPLDTREITFCNSADLICDGIPIVKDAHRTYAKDASAAAEFVAERLAISSLEAPEEKAADADCE
jgi:cutinase